MSYSKPKTNKLKELLYRAQLRPEFISDIQEFRRKYGIPTVGFKTTKEAHDWNQANEHIFIHALRKNQKDVIIPPGSIPIAKRYFKDFANLLRKYSIPAPASGVLKNFIVIGRVGKIPRHKNFFLQFEIPTLKEEHEKGLPFIKVLIYPGASQRDVREYFSKNWKWVSLNLRLLVGPWGSMPIQRRIRGSSHMALNEKICRLAQLSVPELRKMAEREEGSTDTKYTLIKEILRSNLSSTTIRNIRSRYCRRIT